MPKSPKAEDTVRQFWLALNRYAAPLGWVVTRQVVGRSKRGFILKRRARELHFYVKMSQSEHGCWGLSPSMSAEIISGAHEALLLLTGATKGYFIRPARLQRLLPQFSKSADSTEFKINEVKVSKEPRFTAIDRLWHYFEPIAASATTN